MKDSHLQDPKEIILANADPNICEIAKFYVLMVTVALPYPCTIARLTCNMMRNIRVPNVLSLQ